MPKHSLVAAFTTLIATIPLTLTSVAIAQDDADAGALGTGGYIWRPELSPSGPMSVVIDLSKQRAYVSRDGVCIGVSTVSTGKPGYETPTGDYSVTEKARFHRSNRYDNAPMPYMQRLTDSGLALHGGHLPGYPASHGCIRLPYGFAADLFRESSIGMRVTIREHGRSEIAASREVLSADTPGGATPSGDASSGAASNGDASNGDASSSAASSAAAPSAAAPSGEYGTEESTPDTRTPDTHPSEAHISRAHTGLQACEVDDTP
jgi:hypothetical protein